MSVAMNTTRHVDNSSSGDDGSLEFVYEVVSTPVAALMRTGSWVIIVLNAIVLICLVANSSRFPKIYWLQIVCLSANDIMSGVSIFLVSFVDYSSSFKNSIFGCSIVMAIFQATQLSSLFNILGIGIHRYVIIRSMESTKTTWKSRHTVLVNTAAWCLSAMFCTIPYLLWLVPEREFLGYGGCSMETAFGANFPNVMKVYFSGFLLPLIVTNILYTAIYVSLRNKWKTRKYPTTLEKTNEIQTNETLIISRTVQEDADIPARKIEMRENSAIGSSMKTIKIHSTIEGKPQTMQATPDQNNIPLANVYGTSVHENNVAQPSPCNGTNEARNVNPNSRTRAMNHVPGQDVAVNQRRARAIRNQQTAFVLLCILLMLLNLFTWPAISVLFIGSINPSWRLSRALKFPVFTIISMNSMINPVVYTVRVMEFRTIIATVVSTVCHRCLHLCGFNTVLPVQESRSSQDTGDT